MAQQQPMQQQQQRRVQARSWQGALAVHFPLPAQDQTTSALPPSTRAPGGSSKAGTWVAASGTATLHARLDPQRLTFTLRLCLGAGAAAGAGAGAAASSKQGDEPPAQLQADLFDGHCALKLLLPPSGGAAGSGGAEQDLGASPLAAQPTGPAPAGVLLLGAAPDAALASRQQRAAQPPLLGAQPRRQVVAFRFMSVLDARQMQQMVDTAQEVLAEAAAREEEEEERRRAAAATAVAGAPAAPEEPALAPGATAAATGVVDEVERMLLGADDVQLQRLMEVRWRARRCGPLVFLSRHQGGGTPDTRALAAGDASSA